MRGKIIAALAATLLTVTAGVIAQTGGFPSRPRFLSVGVGMAAGPTNGNLNVLGTIDATNIIGDSVSSGGNITAAGQVSANDIISATGVTAVGTVTAANYVGNVGGVSPSDFARLSQANTFTRVATTGLDGAFLISSVVPLVSWYDADGAANNRVWTANGNAERFAIQTRLDDGTSAIDAISIERTGTTVDSVNLQATSVQINGAQVTWGTYSPTVANVTNVSGCAAGTTNSYMRVGNVVTVSGSVSCNSSGAGTVQVDLSIPVASDFTVLSDAAGAGGSAQGTGIGRGVAATISADAIDNDVSIVSTATAAGGFGFFFSYTYTVK